MNSVRRELTAILKCNACTLHRNQCPLVDRLRANRINVCWVGLSAKPEMGNSSRPLSEETRSGTIIGNIERLFPSLQFYRTNLVKCPPMQGKKLRYPTQKEMKDCSAHLLTELRVTRPDLVILLGKQVIEFSMGLFGVELPSFGDEFAYQTRRFEEASLCLVGVHHPSFVNVYRRKHLDEYSSGIAQVIRKTCGAGKRRARRSSSTTSRRR